ncbi:BMP family lipoprotein [Parablautia muri]|uniref:BMP family ABC transporter substrate-binding protein n=1 Tax=Parablautia muri TaxID=2320879 RepID=A0A9X5GRY5_9FIRM|nr:BMP family ABC transporter substrate-binding protein [Parablautia muri]NBJ92440.1 BMP family ABC transporter substrate-binding protein [Parablautia muri]
MRKKIVYRIVGLLLAGALVGCAGGQQQTVSTGTGNVSEDAAADTEKNITKENQGEDAGKVKGTGNGTGSIPQESDVQAAEKNFEAWQALLKSPAEGPEKKLMEDIYGDYKEQGGEIAFVTDGSIKDGSYNDAIYKGIRMYAFSAGVSFSHYNIDINQPDGYQEGLRQAVSNQAKIIVCGGDGFEEAVGTLQSEYPEVSFLLIDGVPVNELGVAVAIEDNVHCVSFEEEESGYLAGYLTVFDGYRNLGFIGGKEVPPVMRYGYGYLQGIDDAAEDMGLSNVTVHYWYADSYEPSQKIRDKALGWYEEGTEVIFACGGSLYQSVLEAAEEGDGLLIGVDVDQSTLSERFLTSATKDISNAVIISLDDFYAAGKEWSDGFAGEAVRYGMKENCTGIPIYDTEWRFNALTMEKFGELHRRIKLGEISISDEIDVQPQVSFTLNVDKTGD